MLESHEREMLAREALARIKRAARVRNLVVTSQPFGSIVDNETREVFAEATPKENKDIRSDFAYGIVCCAKGLEWALEEIDRLRNRDGCG